MWHHMRWSCEEDEGPGGVLPSCTSGLLITLLTHLLGVIDDDNVPARKEGYCWERGRGDAAGRGKGRDGQTPVKGEAKRVRGKGKKGKGREKGNGLGRGGGHRGKDEKRYRRKGNGWEDRAKRM